MLRKFKRFFSLPSPQKVLFLEACANLALMRAAVLIISFKWLTRSLIQHQSPVTPVWLTVAQQHVADLVGDIVMRAANNTLWESACLVQALAAQRMLKKRNIPGLLYLGVSIDKENDGKMKAHAWVQCGESIITGESGYETFTALSVFSWGQH